MPHSSSKSTALEERIGYLFNDRRLLAEALTHTSFQYEAATSQDAHNERLEFLGDSVLSLTIAEALFLITPHLTEADMSKMRSSLVNKAVLHEIALTLSLGEHIRLGRGEESTGGRQKRSILANALEALFGAVLLDSDYPSARALILRLYADKLPLVVARQEDYDFKSELQERCQARFASLPEYRIVKQEGEEHRKVFTAEVWIRERCSGRGMGKSKKEAQMAAAREALVRLDHE
jgi:ribonuclease-3